jgi:hypothetical protein
MPASAVRVRRAAAAAVALPAAEAVAAVDVLKAAASARR